MFRIVRQSLPFLLMSNPTATNAALAPYRLLISAFRARIALTPLSRTVTTRGGAAPISAPLFPQSRRLLAQETHAATLPTPPLPDSTSTTTTRHARRGQTLLSRRRRRSDRGTASPPEIQYPDHPNAQVRRPIPSPTLPLQPKTYAALPSRQPSVHDNLRLAMPRLQHSL